MECGPERANFGKGGEAVGVWFCKVTPVEKKPRVFFPGRRKDTHWRISANEKKVTWGGGGWAGEKGGRADWGLGAPKG